MKFSFQCSLFHDDRTLGSYAHIVIEKLVMLQVKEIKTD